MLLCCVGLMAQNTEKTAESTPVQTVSPTEECINNAAFTFYALSVTMSNSSPVQVYTNSGITLKDNVLNGALPIFPRDKSAGEYRDFTVTHMSITDYKCKQKKGVWTITFNIQKGNIPYTFKYVIDADGVAQLYLINQKTKTTTTYEGRIRAPRVKKNK